MVVDGFKVGHLEERARHICDLWCLVGMGIGVEELPVWVRCCAGERK